MSQVQDRGERAHVIAEQIDHKTAWKKLMLFWYICHYALGITAILLSVTVASKPEFISQEKPNVIAILSWLLAIFTGLVTFLGPKERGDKYQRAFRTLAVVIAKYLNDPTYTLNHVLDAYEKGEDIIHGTKESEKQRRLT